MVTIKKNLQQIGRFLCVLENDIIHSTESEENKEASIETINSIRRLIK